MYCIIIESEAKDHHRLLDDVGGDFDSSSGKQNRTTQSPGSYIDLVIRVLGFFLKDASDHRTLSIYLSVKLKIRWGGGGGVYFLCV